MESQGCETIYSLIQKYATSCGLPVEVMSLEMFKAEVFDNSFYFWWRSPDDIFALVNIGAIEPQPRRAEFGVISLQPRKGYAAEACFAILAYGFNVLNLHRMYALVNADNTASINLCRKHGMILEGVHRQSRFKQGKYIDQMMFGVLENERHIWVPGEGKVEKDASSGSGGGDGSGGGGKGSTGEKGSQVARQDSEKKPVGKSQIRFAGELSPNP